MSELNIYHFVQHIIRQAKRKQESRDSQAIREIAALRSGMSITTEYRAYPYVLPDLGNASPRERMVALRCAAMIAEYADLGAIRMMRRRCGLASGQIILLGRLVMMIRWMA